jgi:hypothetical protein
LNPEDAMFAGMTKTPSCNPARDRDEQAERMTGKETS